jgi:hypothetical protein
MCVLGNLLSPGPLGIGPEGLGPGQLPHNTSRTKNRPLRALSLLDRGYALLRMDSRGSREALPLPAPEDATGVMYHRTEAERRPWWRR